MHLVHQGIRGTYMHCRLLKSACQSMQQGGLASPRGTQQQGHPPWLQNPIDIIQHGELCLGGLHEANLLQNAL